MRGGTVQPGQKSHEASGEHRSLTGVSFISAIVTCANTAGEPAAADELVPAVDPADASVYDALERLSSCGSRAECRIRDSKGAAA